MKKLSTRFIAGIIIVIIGITTLLSNLGIAHFNDLLITWWPLLLVVWGICLFIDNPRKYLWPTIIVIFGILWQLENLKLITFNPWQLIWPAALILIGGSLLFNRKMGHAKLSVDDRHDVTAILSGSDIKSNSPNFKGGKVTAVMGGAQFDLHQATIKKSATIEVFAFWGGIELTVPKGVLVKNQTNNILGGTEDHTGAPEKSDAPTLTIIGDVIMSGVEVKAK